MKTGKILLASQDSAEEDININILPMIDVLFAILIFFILASMLLTQSRQIAINRPKASSETITKEKAIKITINKDKKIAINGKAVPLNRIAKTINTMSISEIKNGAIIDADSSLSYQVVVSLLNSLKQTKVDSLGLAIDSSESTDSSAQQSDIQ